MEENLAKLVEISGPALSSLQALVVFPSFVPSFIAEELTQLLTVKNGFYAFEQALHVRPSQGMGESPGLDTWNSLDLWVAEYHGLADESYFFAEDVFGVQFGIKKDGVYSFDPEIGCFEYVAPNISGWAKSILENYNFLTGYSLAHDWQVANGQLNPGERLIPKQPFVLQGAYTAENLYSLEAVATMRQRAKLAIQIRDLPDGTQITWNHVE